MLGARLEDSTTSEDSWGLDFTSAPKREVTEPYRSYPGRLTLHRTDWTYYAPLDEAKPIVLHLDWSDSLG